MNFLFFDDEFIGTLGIFKNEIDYLSFSFYENKRRKKLLTQQRLHLEIDVGIVCLDFQPHQAFFVFIYKTRCH